MIDAIFETINQYLAAILSGKNIHPTYCSEGHIVCSILISNLVSSLIHEKVINGSLFSNYRIVSGEYNYLFKCRGIGRRNARGWRK